METIRLSHERGYEDMGWLKSHHSFSFGHYFDPNHMGHRNLRVINEDLIAGHTGFPTHGHQDMEIITYMLSGTLTHEDSMGHRKEIKTGEIQVMSAGTGVTHSEMNLYEKPVHLLQIWIVPKEKGITPSYSQKLFHHEMKKNNLLLIADGNQNNDSLYIHANASVYACDLDAGKYVNYEMTREGGNGWIQLIHGEVEVETARGKVVLREGDALALSHERSLGIHALVQTEFLLFDLE